MKRANVTNAYGDREYGKRSTLQFSRYLEENLVKKNLEEIPCNLPNTTRSTFLMVFSSDGSSVASTHGDHNIYVCDSRTGSMLRCLEGHSRTPWCVVFHPAHSDVLASGCLAGEVRVWDLHGGSETWISPNKTAISSLSFHPVDKVLVIATGNEIHFWDWNQPEPFAKCKTNHENEKVRYVKFDPLGHRLITGISNTAAWYSPQHMASNFSASLENQQDLDLLRSHRYGWRNRMMSRESSGELSQESPGLLSALDAAATVPIPEASVGSALDRERSGLDDARRYAHETNVVHNYLSLGDRLSESVNRGSLFSSSQFLAQYQARISEILSRIRVLRERVETARAMGEDDSSSSISATSVPYSVPTDPYSRYMVANIPTSIESELEAGQSRLEASVPPFIVQSLTRLARIVDGLSDAYTNCPENCDNVAHNHELQYAIQRSIGDMIVRFDSLYHSMILLRRYTDPRRSQSENSGGSSNGEASTSGLSEEAAPAGDARSDSTSEPDTGSGVAMGQIRTQLHQLRHRIRCLLREVISHERCVFTPADYRIPDPPVRHNLATTLNARILSPEHSPTQVDQSNIENTMPANWANSSRRVSSALSERIAEYHRFGGEQRSGYPLVRSRRFRNSIETMENTDNNADSDELVVPIRPQEIPTMPLSGVPTVASLFPSVPRLRVENDSGRLVSEISPDSPGNLGSGGLPHSDYPRAQRGTSQPPRPRSPPLNEIIRRPPSMQAARARISQMLDSTPGSGSYYSDLSRLVSLENLGHQSVGNFATPADSAVFNNVINLTHRIQCWDFTKCEIPEIGDADANVVVPECKIHSDASVDVSADGALLVALFPCTVSVPASLAVGIFSLDTRNLGMCYHTCAFGPNAISVSLSPSSRYLMVGFATRRLVVLGNANKQVVAQMFELKPGETELENCRDVEIPLDGRQYLSLNCIRWGPVSGQGLVYGTSRGELKLCHAGSEDVIQPNAPKQKAGSTTAETAGIGSGSTVTVVRARDLYSYINNRFRSQIQAMRQVLTRATTQMNSRGTQTSEVSSDDSD